LPNTQNCDVILLSPLAQHIRQLAHRNGIVSTDPDIHLSQCHRQLTQQSRSVHRGSSVLYIQRPSYCDCVSPVALLLMLCPAKLHPATFTLDCVKGKKVKECTVLSEIHLRTIGCLLSMGSQSVICHPTEVTIPPSPQPVRLVLDLSTP